MSDVVLLLCGREETGEGEARAECGCSCGGHSWSILASGEAVGEVAFGHRGNLRTIVHIPNHCREEGLREKR